MKATGKNPETSVARRPLQTLVLAAVAALTFVVPLEAALRVFPDAIPLSLLTEFESHLRSRIAKRRNLQRLDDTVVIPRNDGGPADRMWIYKPRIEVTEPFDEPGIVATVRMDDMGFCNSAAGAYRALERIDVAAVGDSFTFCTNVDPSDTWPERLGRIAGLRAYNFGLPGRGLHEYLQALDTFALAKKPRFVVLAVYEGNDLRDAVRFQEGKDRPSARAERPCPFGIRAFCRWHDAARNGALGRRSYAVNLALASLWRIAYGRGKRDIDFRYEVRFPDGKTATFNSRNGDLDEVTYARALVGNEVRLDLFDEPLTAFAELADRDDFTPIVAYIPSAYTAYAGLAHFDDASVRQTLTQFSDRQRSYFARKTAELSLRYRDITPALQDAAVRSGSSSPLYFRTNVHLTPAGHQVVAGEIAAEIAAASVD